MLIDKPIVFVREYKTITKSTVSALFLSQLVYWWKRRTGDTVWKTIDEFEIETGLTRDEQDTAIRNLKSLNIITVQLKGIPAKRHFTLNETSLLELLKPVCGIPANCVVETPQTNTENTHSITNVILQPPQATVETLKGESNKGVHISGIATIPKPTNRRQFGNFDVNSVISELSKLMPTGKLDGSELSNRRAAQSLIKKYGFSVILKAIRAIPKSRLSDKITSIKTLSFYVNILLMEADRKPANYMDEYTRL